MSVEVFSWNPSRRIGTNRLWRLVPIRRPVDNFGDLLGPLIVAALLDRADIQTTDESPNGAKQLMSVGSVLHLARPGATVWGSGVNGKIEFDYSTLPLDVRAVRGPRTAAVLRRAGHTVPSVFGDPALLLGRLFPALLGLPRTSGVTVVMNLNDQPHPTAPGLTVLDPRAPLRTCLETIGSSEFVVGSSLHGLVVADALGIPSRPIVSTAEPAFKYEDYYEGTGRRFDPQPSVEAALRSGPVQALDYAVESLLEAFPYDLWTGDGTDRAP